MDLITIFAIDKHSSDTMSRTFSIHSIAKLNADIRQFEVELPFLRYELTCDELMENYPEDILNMLDDMDITY